MYAIPNVMNKVLPLLAANTALITANGVLIADNTTAIGVNTTSIGANITAIAGILSTIAAMGFVDRGDPDDEDYDITQLTRDGAYHDMDLSSIVGTGAKLVLLAVKANANAANKVFKFKTKGNSYEYNIAEGLSQVSNVNVSGDFLVLTDANGVIEYNFDAAFGNSIFVTVAGWYI